MSAGALIFLSYVADAALVGAEYGLARRAGARVPRAASAFAAAFVVLFVSCGALSYLGGAPGSVHGWAHVALSWAFFAAAWRARVFRRAFTDSGRADEARAALERALEESRRLYEALRSAVADERVAMLGWDGEERLCIVEGGLYRAHARPPRIGDDARAMFEGFAPRAAAAFERIAGGEPDDYDVTDPETGRVYHVYGRPNLVPRAGYALAIDVTEDRERERELKRLHEAEADRARRAEAGAALDVLYEAARRRMGGADGR